MQKHQQTLPGTTLSLDGAVLQLATAETHLTPAALQHGRVDRHTPTLACRESVVAACVKSISMVRGCWLSRCAVLCFGCAGQERFRALTSTFYRGAVGIIFGA